MKLYLGFDGSYVLSRYPLKIFMDGDQPFLATGRVASCIDIQPSEARYTLGGLKLKPWEVVVVQVGRKKFQAQKAKVRK